MPVTYINRKGFTYFLNMGATKTGKPRYYFARQQKGEPVEEIPQGYQIDESLNGIVSLAKSRPQLIPSEEAASVEAALKRHPKARSYRVAVKNDQSRSSPAGKNRSLHPVYSCDALYFGRPGNARVSRRAMVL